jgi:TldD protein
MASDHGGIDPSFLALPYQRLAEAALNRARDFGVGHADFRFERVRYQHLAVRDGQLQGAEDSEDLGFAVRVLHEGAWGFASGVLLTRDEAVKVAEQAVRVAQVALAMTRSPIALAPEPVHADAVWISAYDVNPLDVPLGEKADVLRGWTSGLIAADGVDHASAGLQQVQENKYYADLTGTTTTQQRVRLEPHVEAFGSDERTGAFDSMRTIAPPAGRGWEYVVGGPGVGFDFDSELAEIPGLLREKLVAPGVEAGTYDLVIHPSNLWLTIHESIGHATELDRALGYEANYAGTSFATYDQLGTLRYGSPVMHVIGDRTSEHGLASIGYDDEGVETQSWDIVRGGTLVGYQLDRSMAHTYGAELNGGRSNGCAYADSPGHFPIQRMANVSLQPDPDGPDTAGLIGRVERGIYVVGDRSWSIDMQRYNFQFTGQRFYRIEDGQLKGQLRDVAYQATTTDFWGSMEAVGGPQTYEVGGAFNCGKAQPGQVASVSHGCPSALFRQVRILNTTDEAGPGGSDAPGATGDPVDVEGPEVSA